MEYTYAALNPGELIRDRVPHFSLRKLRPGGRRAVIVVNGFWSQGDEEITDWTAAISGRFRNMACYHLDWDACRHPKHRFAELLTMDGLLAPRKTPGVIDALTAWHAAMSSAERAGHLLASAILRTPGWRFTLAGHSLGGRVVHFALRELARHPVKRIENAYLLGAAVGGGVKDNDCWTKVASAVRGRVFNCYSRDDAVLSLAYRAANLMLSEPAGHSGVKLEHDRLVDVDCKDLVDSHFKWKSNFDTILARLEN